MPVLSCWNQTTAIPGHDISALHIHERCELLYLWQGGAQMKIGNKQYTLKPHQLAIIGRLQLHDLVPTQWPYSRIGLHIDTDALGNWGIPSFLASLFIPHSEEEWCHVFDLSNHMHIYRLLEDIYRENQQEHPSKNEMLGVLLHQLLLYLYRAYPERFHRMPRDPVMEKVRQYIEAHYADSLSVQQLAAQSYLTPSHFIIRFKKYTGYTPYKYRNMCRIAHARYLLTNEDLSLNSVAEQCGFSDLNGFIRCFRETMEVTPGKFRELSAGRTFDV